MVDDITVTLPITAYMTSLPTPFISHMLGGRIDERVLFSLYFFLIPSFLVVASLMDARKLANVRPPHMHTFTHTHPHTHPCKHTHTHIHTHPCSLKRTGASIMVEANPLMAPSLQRHSHRLPPPILAPVLPASPRVEARVGVLRRDGRAGRPNGMGGTAPNAPQHVRGRS